MILVRFLPEIAHFRVRALEWIVAGMMATTALVLAQPEETMLQPQLVVLHHLASETFWTWLTGIIAAVRLGALYVNGAVRQTPVVRAVTAFLSGLFWLGFSLGVSVTGRASISAAIVPWLALADLYSLHRAVTDMKTVRDRLGSVSDARPVPH